MAANIPGMGIVGLRNVGSYQVSGQPWITGSTLNSTVVKKVAFPYVTKTINVQVTGTNPVHLSLQDPQGTNSAKSGKHQYTLSGSASTRGFNQYTFNVKCNQLWMSGNQGTQTGFQMFAELTNIPQNSMYTLTGSGIDS